jgi:hypothetical protein
MRRFCLLGGFALSLDVVFSKYTSLYLVVLLHIKVILPIKYFPEGHQRGDRRECEL